ncbi:MAG: serine aminopeptidase domain-containing protein, partial [Erysipelotrichaceae bacterium]
MIQTGKMKSFDGTNLYYRVDGVNNPRAMVVIVHGLAEHHRRYDELTAFFNANEISVLRYDQRGHGLSEGTRGYLNKATD